MMDGFKIFMAINENGLPHTPPPALGQAALLFICVPYNSCISRTIWLCFGLLRQMLL